MDTKSVHMFLVLSGFVIWKSSINGRPSTKSDIDHQTPQALIKITLQSPELCTTLAHLMFFNRQVQPARPGRSNQVKRFNLPLLLSPTKSTQRPASFKSAHQKADVDA